MEGILGSSRSRPDSPRGQKNFPITFHSSRRKKYFLLALFFRLDPKCVPQRFPKWTVKIFSVFCIFLKNCTINFLALSICLLCDLGTHRVRNVEKSLGNFLRFWPRKICPFPKHLMGIFGRKMVRNVFVSMFWRVISPMVMMVIF